MDIQTKQNLWAGLLSTVSAFHAASFGVDLFPAGWRIVRRHDANGFNFVNLAAPYFIDVHGRHIKGFLIGHIGFGPVRVARDFEFFLRHRMMEM